MTDTRIFRRKKTYNLFRGLPLSPKQARSLVRSTAKFNIWNGAIRSGKTFTTQLRWLQYLADAPKGGDFVMVGRTRDSIARNVIGPMQDPNIFGQFADHVKYTSGAPFAMIMGVRVYVLGASDAKAEKVIRGMTLAGAYVDEITILSQEFFTQLIGRLSVPGAQLFGTTNPDNPEHWLKKNYLDKIGPDKKKGELWNWKAWFFQLTDNPTLTSGYRQTLESSFHGLFYKRFVLGQWVAAEGAVYDIFNHQEHVKDIDELCGDDNPIIKYLCIGADYGTTNATAAVLLGMTRNGELYVVDEFVYKPSDRALRKTDAQLSQALREWVNKKHDQYFPSAEEVPVILDPAAASFHVQLRTDKTQTISAVNDVLYGIRLVTALLGAGKLFINPRCTNLISEFSGYTWDPKATAEGRDAVIKTNDHCLVGDTMIATLDGLKRIDEVTAQDKVLTRNGYQRVLDAWKTMDNAEIMEVETEDGIKVRGTGNHKFWTENRGWVRLDELTLCDTLLACPTVNKSSTTAKATADTQTQNPYPTAPITDQADGTEAPPTFTETSGKTSTGQSQKASKSTTKTETQATTAPITSPVSPLKNIWNTISRNIKNLKNGGKNPENEWTTPENSPTNGTAQKKAANGTENTANGYGETGNPTHCPANNAAQNTKPKASTEQSNSVPTSAKQNGDVNQASTTKPEPAPNVELNSPSTSISKLKHVAENAERNYGTQIVAIRKLETRESVYDLTVENEHEFFANGILVHNCLDALRYSISTTEKIWRRFIDISA